MTNLVAKQLKRLFLDLSAMNCLCHSVTPPQKQGQINIENNVLHPKARLVFFRNSKF